MSYRISISTKLDEVNVRRHTKEKVFRKVLFLNDRTYVLKSVPFCSERIDFENSNLLERFTASPCDDMRELIGEHSYESVTCMHKI